MNYLLEKILEFLFPQKCIGCGFLRENICDKCRIGLLAEIEDSLRIKRESYSHKNSLDQLFYCQLYANKSLLNKIIFAYKFNSRVVYAKILAEIVNKKIIEINNQFFPEKLLICPIPAEKSKIIKRGFDHIKLIIQSLKISTNNYAELLNCTNLAHEQKNLSGNERKINIINKFSIDPKFLTQLSDSKILLIDDISTTGSTLNEAAKILKLAGANKVYGLVFLKQVKV